MIFCIFLVLIFIRPFVSYAYAETSALFPALLLVASLPLIIQRRAKLRRFTHISIPTALFCASLIASCFMARDKTNALMESTRYTVGLLVFFVALILSNEERKALVNTLLAGGVVISALALYQYAFGFKNLEAYCAAHQITDEFIKSYIAKKRVFMPFFGPNMLAGYLAMAAPLSLLYKKSRLLLAPMALALLLTQSIGAIASIIVAAAIVFLLAKIPAKKKAMVVAALVLGLVAILCLRFSDEAASHQPGFSLKMRTQYWSETLSLIKKHPLTGMGMGSFDISKARHAHNVFLELWAECGIAGFISFFLLCGCLLRNGARKITAGNPALLLTAVFYGVLVFILHNLVDITFFFPETAMTWWLLAGLLASFSL